ncbi:MAG: TonB-dependent receptor [Bacteroidetes bacterium]|nr:TonB-dependent receptor [Bacteroidota bacterium]
MKIKIYLSLLLCILFCNANTQNLSQNIKGKVVDAESESPITGATVVIENTNPLQGAVTGINGDFNIKNVNVGRYNLKISFLGYETIQLTEILVSSAKEVVLNIRMKESLKKMDEVIIKADKNQAINSMATLSVRQFSVEEARRYAGGMDDPARLASSFAGVSGNLGTNGIVIRGNAPKGLLWMMEGIEITNPSHFANVSSLGSGAITALSSQMLANSDFYTGAFPAEYGNALSGVFDIKLRTGNNEKRENTFQLGLIGIDASSEGPFVKDKKASYLFNYRYSTLSLLAPILPPEMGKLRYQDLSLKLNFPTEKAGIFSVWGLGALDYQGRDALTDSLKWEKQTDKEQYYTDLFMVAAGINHKILINTKAFINTSIAASGNGLQLNQQELNSNKTLLPNQRINNNVWKYTFTSYINYKFSARHSNRTGFNINRLQYNMHIEKADSNNVLKDYTNTSGYSYLIQAFSQSRINITEKFALNLGLHSQLFALNNHYSLEPRIGLIYDITPKQSLRFSYGIHSQLEPLNFYFVQKKIGNSIIEPNKKLDFSKAHHLVLSYDLKFNEKTHLCIEPYFQYLFNIPVIPDSYFSLQNLENTIFFNDSLVNKGSGRNIGIDITYERFLNQGFYYLITLSVFDSKYTGGDGIQRNARFNKHYVVNLLCGKEWKVGKNKNNLLGINAKLCLMGGDYLNPVDYAQTYANKDIVEDVAKAFSVQKPDAQVLSFSLNYRINKAKHSSVWSINFVNALFYSDLNKYYFDTFKKSVEKDVNELVIPNISYKIEF